MKSSSARASIAFDETEFLSAKVSSLFRVLLYFEIFRFPLTQNELWSFSKFNSKSEFADSLKDLVERGYIQKENGFYSLSSPTLQISERQAGEKRAKSMWRKACRRARFIQKFPFVRAVFISGSISKGVVAPDGDVDFFIITKPGRLWLSRTLLALYKKVFLLGSHRYFCINYFIDYDFLKIEEQNLFTATEMATLIPMTGNMDLISKFFERNAWILDYYPNFVVSKPLFQSTTHKRRKSFTEKCLDIIGASVLEKFSLWITTSFWKMKFKEMPDKDFQTAMKSNEHVSKHHPLQFQKRVLKAFSDKISNFENTNGLKLKS